MSPAEGAARRRKAGGRPFAVSGADRVRVDEPSWQRTELPNGVRVVSEPVPGARSLSVGVWVGLGSRDEPAERAGLCHVLEHLIFKGTEAHDARALSLAFDAVGGEMNAYTAKERTAYYSRVPAGADEIGVDLLLDAVTGAALRAEDLAAERDVILEELAGAEDDPIDWADTKLYEVLFADHPLGREVIGSAETVAAIGRDDVAGFVAEQHRGANLVITAAGVVDHERLVDAVEARFGHLAPGVRPQREAPGGTGKGRIHVRRRTEQTQLTLGWRCGGLHNADRYALTVLEHVLGDGPASRLFYEVRERRALAYSVGTSLSLYSDVGTLVVSTAVAPDRGAETRKVIEGEIGRVAADGITEEELAAAQGFVIGSTLLGLEEASTCMARLGYLELTYDTIAPIETYLDKIRAVTLADVQRVAATTFAATPAVATVGPRTVR
ncbi:MAG: M16 family metallopeptidase [Acidimicrobiia bacterium]